MSDVLVKFPKASVVPAQRPSVVAVTVRSASVKAVKLVGGSGASSYSVYSKFLQIDGGNPFSVFSEEDVLDGGKPSDW